MYATLSTLLSNVLVTGSQTLAGLAAFANNLVPVPSLQTAAATANTPSPVFGETTSRWSMLYEGRQRGGGHGDGQGPSPSSGGSSSPSHAFPGAKIPRLFSRPGTPWQVGTISEKTIAKTWETTRPPEEKIRAAAIELAFARANMIRDLKESRRVRNLALDVFFEPTRIAGHEIRRVEDIEPALRAYLKEATGLDFPELPTWGKRLDIIFTTLKRKPEAMNRALGQAIRSYFHLRRYLWGESLFVPEGPQLLLRPEISEPEFSDARLHEFEHLVGHTNGPLSRRAPKGLFGLGARLFGLANPFRFVTNTATWLYEEGHAIGAQWELHHRIPQNIREHVRNKYHEKLKALGLTDAEIGSGPWAFRAALKQKFGKDHHLSVTALHHYMGYHQIGFADLSKREYVRRIRIYSGYSTIGFLTRQRSFFRFFKEEQALKTFFSMKVVGALQFAGSTAGWAYLASRFLE